MKSFIPAGFFLLVPLLLAGCVTTRAELNRQREEAGVAAPEKLESSESAQAPSDPPPSMTEDELREALAKAQGRVEELQHEQEQKDQTHAEELQKAEARIAELEKRLKELSPDEPEVPEGKSPMEAGKDAFADGDWDGAIGFFSKVLDSNGKGKAFEEATYLRGESYFKKREFAKAVLDYSKFPESLHKSSYHPKALLRIAESFEAMGRKDEARMFYEDLVGKFAKTAEGRIARKKLKK